jgi:hypothetical protein
MYQLVLSFLLAFILGAQGCSPNRPTAVDGGSIKTNGHETYWVEEDFPLWVLIDEHLPDTHIQATIEAVDTWNTELSVQAFEPIIYDHSRTAPRGFGFVVVSMSDLGQSARDTRILGLARSTLHVGTARMRASQIQFDEGLDETLLLVVMIHELGHALTLEHDNDCGSIMYPSVVNCEGLVAIRPDDLIRVRAMVNGTRAHIPLTQDMDFLPEVWRHIRCTP